MDSHPDNNASASLWQYFLLVLIVSLLPLNSARSDFLQQHWQYPIAAQGPPPAHYSTLESDLTPAACGSCHQQQLEDWSGARHSKAMGPGVMGQLVDMLPGDPGTVTLCQQCHAPLAEQQPNSPISDPELRSQGMVCAACHLRKRQVFGPPARTASRVSSGTKAPHNGFTPRQEFTRSEFCAGCHQFSPGGFAINGKLLENTFEEWKASSYATENIQCQSCHMPDRRHLWRGIHDPEMVKKGVTIEVKIPAGGFASSEQQLSIPIAVSNSGTGHRFPTYVTPKVYINAQLIDPAGQPMTDSFRQAIIGRDITMDLSQELFDTRIAPGETFEVDYQYAIPPAGSKLRVWIEVDPDNFYQRFYKIMLASNGPQKGRTQLQQAYQESRNSPFLIYDKEFVLAIR